jgi:EAL domain-containing protein (putative c-di-GMP-specific phosphodiesterase class I)
MATHTAIDVSAFALMREGGLRAVYQPIVDIVDGGVVGYEALARGPSGSSLEMPNELFAAAREEGILGPFDHATPTRWQRLFVTASAVTISSSSTSSPAAWRARGSSIGSARTAWGGYRSSSS